MNCFVGSIAERTADPDTIIISKVASDFADYHWYGIGGKLYVLG